jgi:hypothetical protein
VRKVLADPLWREPPPEVLAGTVPPDEPVVEWPPFEVPPEPPEPLEPRPW